MDKDGTSFQPALSYSPTRGEYGFDPGEEELHYLRDAETGSAGSAGPAVDVDAGYMPRAVPR